MFGSTNLHVLKQYVLPETMVVLNAIFLVNVTHTHAHTQNNNNNYFSLKTP